MDEAKNFGTDVRSTRECLGISQEGLGYLAGLHRTYIGSIERGERNVTLLSICRLAQALGCEPVDLLEGIRHEMKNGGELKN